MRQKRITRAAKGAMIGAAMAALLYAFPTGPPPGVTGAPGENTCTQCHFAGDMGGSGGGKVEIAFPGGMTYVPGVGQQLTITITDADALRYGFQLSARLAGDNSQAGTLNPAAGEESSIKVICSNGAPRGASGCPATAPVEYVEHSSPRQANTFLVEWIPPAAGSGPVGIYVAANAANGNGRQTGDDIYTASYTLNPQSGGRAPGISEGGVVNAWSFRNLVGDSAWITIFGSNLAPTTRSWRADEIVEGKLPTSLDGVSVKINNQDTYVYYISPEQINAQAPKDGAAGPVPVQVTTPSGSSDIVMVNKQVTAPALFTWAGLAPGAELFVGAVGAELRPDGSFDYIAPPGLLPGLTTRAAKPGETVLMFATGCEPTAPSIPAGEVITPPYPTVDSPVAFSIGGLPAQVAGDTGFLIFAGECQFNVTIPTAAPDGNLPVTLEIGGISTQTTQPEVSIPVESSLQEAGVLADIQVAYRLDPWLIGGSYGGGFWVAPPDFGPTTQGGNTFTLETRAEGRDAEGRLLDISPQWVPSDPGMVTVTPSEGKQVTMTIQRNGESSLQVSALGVTNVLTIKASYQGASLFVEIAQQQ